MANSILASIGHHGFWGFSCCFDFIEAAKTHAEGSIHDSEPFRILLVHPGDIRHILCTISRRRRHITSSDSILRPIHFYLLEWPVEAIGRELLFLEGIYDTEVPIRQRGTIFLEIFGNCKVQERTSRYIESLGKDLRNFVTNGKGRLQNIVDLSLLKYRDKDYLEEVFKSYSTKCTFDIDTLRDHRLRGHYADRYDARISLSDWDWHVTYKSTASIIHIRQFKDWRSKGIAFEFGDQTYTDPNRTMMSYTEGVMKKGKDQGFKKEVS